MLLSSRTTKFFIGWSLCYTTAMRKNTFILFGVVLLFVAGSAVYFLQNKKDVPVVAEPIVQNPVLVNTKPQDFCFYKETPTKNLKDIMWLKLTTTGNNVTGELHILPAEKDKKFGMFSGDIGSLVSSTMTGYSDLWWTANGEGVVQKEELRIALANSEKGAEASVAFGSMILGDNGAYTYKDKESLTYQSMPQVNCDQMQTLTNATYTDINKTFSITYPKDFTFIVANAKSSMVPTQQWMFGSSIKGSVLATVYIPRNFQPKTNFGEAVVNVGVSADKIALQSCTSPQPNAGQVSIGNVNINNIPFSIISSTDAGAGNFYDVTSYRTVYKNKCYNIESVVHSMNIGNYPTDQGITAFDKDAVQKVLDTVVNSFILK